MFDQTEETDKFWVDDKQRSTQALHADKLWLETKQSEQHAERQQYDDTLQEKTFGEAGATERQTDRYWTESRHPERHVEKQWTVDRYTQRQIDRKIERQWMGGRQIERLWSENKPTDLGVDNQWTEGRQHGRKTERHVQPLSLSQRPLPPYPSDQTPSPKTETDTMIGLELSLTEWQQQDTLGDRHMFTDSAGAFTEGWRSSAGGAGGRSGLCASKPDPPPQSSKPNLTKLRPRHRLESADALPRLPSLPGTLSLLMSCRNDSTYFSVKKKKKQNTDKIDYFCFTGTDEEGELETDPGKIEKKEREKRRNSESQPPPIPEKVCGFKYLCLSLFVLGLSILMLENK